MMGPDYSRSSVVVGSGFGSVCGSVGVGLVWVWVGLGVIGFGFGFGLVWFGSIFGCGLV